jgi:hypothetical protein
MWEEESRPRLPLRGTTCIQHRGIVPCCQVLEVLPLLRTRCDVIQHNVADAVLRHQSAVLVLQQQQVCCQLRCHASVALQPIFDATWLVFKPVVAVLLLLLLLLLLILIIIIITA